MIDYGPYSVHPIAELFPLLEAERLGELVTDIRDRGLQEPIVLRYGSAEIVDGRNRYIGCQEAMVDPRFRVLPESFTEDQIVDFILAANAHRRHLDNGQLSVIGVRIEQHFAEQAKERQGTRTDLGNIVQNSARSRDQAAAAVGVSHDSISRAKKITEVDPGLADKVLAKTISLNDAYKQAKAKERAQPSSDKEKPGPEIIVLRTHEGTEVPYQKPKAKPTFNPQPTGHIDWAKWSWNPVTGCLHGCEYCYARDIAYHASAGYPVKFTPLFHHERLGAPANHKVPAEAEQDPRFKRVFVCSMADLYGKWVPLDWIKRVHDVCRDNQQWDYLFLTKFPSRYVKLDLPPTAWVGTSVDSQRRVTIAEEAFRKIEGVRVKWLSLEPLLEPLAFSDLSMFDWVVIGSKTETVQPGGVGLVPAFAPPIEWVSSIIDQARAAGCAVYLKPNLLGVVSSQSPGMRLPQEIPFSR